MELSFIKIYKNSVFRFQTNLTKLTFKMKKGLWMNNEPIDLFSSGLASHAPQTCTHTHAHICTHRTGMPWRRMASILPRLNVEADRPFWIPWGNEVCAWPLLAGSENQPQASRSLPTLPREDGARYPQSDFLSAKERKEIGDRKTK